MSLDARYFDHAATAPPWPRALDAARHCALRFPANPSSPHPAGRAARRELERLREAFARSCGARGFGLVVGSGASEANAMVIQAVLRDDDRGRVLVAEDVHPSIWNAFRRHPGKFDVIPLESTGAVSPQLARRLIGKHTRLVCVSHACHETGVIHELAPFAALCAEKRVKLLVDGTQALGRLPVSLSKIGCDYYTWSAHKFGGPRGVGGCFVKGAALAPLWEGGSQENGMRPGTENLPGLAGAWAALAECLAVSSTAAKHLRRLAGHFLATLKETGLSFNVNGDPGKGLPGLISVSIQGTEGRALVTELGMAGFQVGNGAACSADLSEASRVILALGRGPELAKGTLRVSMGRGNTLASVIALAEKIAVCAAGQRMD